MALVRPIAVVAMVAAVAGAADASDQASRIVDRIAVTTKSKAPIALVSVDDATGKAGIWVARSRCRAAD